MKKAVMVQVRGRVQGVGFRYHTLKKARELEVTGIVKNMPDGSVYIEAEADPGALESFLTWCHEGPRWASVEEVVVYSLELRNFSEFSIS